MAADLLFSEEEMAIDEGLGYPKAYAKLCRDRDVNPYSHGPPFTFTPYALQQNEALRARELDELFPIIDPKGKPSVRPKIFVSLLWKQLNHLGNAGFDPATFRVDPYGNVLYFHADSASPLAWDIDHWFPCSRGGLTVPSNLRILQWQVCKKKQNKLEFLIPWWDLQVGISINQFLSIFASSNSDFRHRAFSLLFYEGESEELNASQTVDSHAFPQHFIEAKEKVGLATAAVVVSRREPYDSSSTLKSLDINRRPRSNSPIIAARRLKGCVSKENDNPDMVTNPYQAIVMARDSLRQREETAKIQNEIQKLDDEVNELKQKTEEEKLAIQDLELVLIKRKRRAEKCRRLAESQSSYRGMLEKMIRDAMHQSVIYKEQVRLNQAAANALMARLEAQKAICDSSEKELHRKFMQREELEKQVRPESGEQARKRSRMDDSLCEENDDRTVLYLPANKPRTKAEDALLGKRDDKNILYLTGAKSRTHLHKQLRVFLEEEEKVSEAGLLLNGEKKEEGIEEGGIENVDNTFAAQRENLIEDRIESQRIGEKGEIYNIQFPEPEPEIEEEDEESRRQRGKGNLEKWLQFLLENSPEGCDTNPQNVDDKETSRTDEIIRKLNLKYPVQNAEVSGLQEPQGIGEKVEEERVEEAVQQKDGGRSEEDKVEIEDKSIPIKNYPYKLLTAKSKANELGGEEVESRSRSSSPVQERKVQQKDGGRSKEEMVEIENKSTPIKNPPYKLLTEKIEANELSGNDVAGRRSSSFAVQGKKHRRGKEKGLVRSESARAFRRIPSSPSLISGMKKGVDFIWRKKPSVIGDDDGYEEHARRNSFIKSSIKTIKRAVKI